MDIQKNLLELEESAQRISDGLTAMQVMVLGLDGAGSQYAGALHVLYDYLSKADQAFRTHLSACLNET